MPQPTNATPQLDAHAAAHNFHYDVKAHFGATGDGSTDDTASFHAARDAADGGTILVPPGHYKVSSLDWTHNALVKGSGWWNVANDPFGHAHWGSGNYGTYFGGTVIRCTNTTTRGMLAASSGKRTEFHDFMLLGPGSGTSTGLEVGTVSNGYAGMMSNILVANFSRGYLFNFAEDCTFVQLASRGCPTGITLANATNQNTWIQTEVQFSTVRAIDTGLGTLNMFVGGLMQNCTGVGAYLTGNANHLKGFYCENTGITYAAQFVYGAGGSNGGYNSFTDAYLSTADEDILCQQDFSRIGPIRHGVGGYTLTLDATSFSTVEDAGGATIVDTSGGYNTLINANAASTAGMQTGGQVIAVQGVVTKTKAGTPSDADFPLGTPPVGTIVVDTTANKIWVRTAAATWKGVVVA